MKSITLLLAIFCLAHQPSFARHQFFTDSTAPSSHLSVPKVKSFVASRNEGKFLLQWEMETNTQVSMFEVEKSADGKSFKTAAIVFGTDSEQLAAYQFFEKAGKKKMYYRLKIIRKDGTVELGERIEVR